MAEDEEKENPCANFEKGKRFGEWSICVKLDEGGFGQVYKVESVRQPGRYAALKAEPNDVEGGSAIKLEMHVLKLMHSDGEKIHIPTIYQAAKHKKFCYMVMMLLGENLKHLKAKMNENLSVATWSRIAMQCLYGIKLVHDYGFIHRDIKPNNFVMGYPEDDERCRIVHILDFGLTRPYASKDKNGVWRARRARGSAEFRGTLRYCSPNVHQKLEQGRADDLWGLLYVIIECHTNLPWQTCNNRDDVAKSKESFKNNKLMQKMPNCLEILPESLNKLNCYQRPPYSIWYKAFKELAVKETNQDYWKPFDWEDKSKVEQLKQRWGARPLPKWWSDGESFFASDPVNISGPPPPSTGKKTIVSHLQSKDTRTLPSNDSRNK